MLRLNIFSIDNNFIKSESEVIYLFSSPLGNFTFRYLIIKFTFPIRSFIILILLSTVFSLSINETIAWDNASHIWGYFNKLLSNKALTIYSFIFSIKE